MTLTDGIVIGCVGAALVQLIAPVFFWALDRIERMAACDRDPWSPPVVTEMRTWTTSSGNRYVCVSTAPGRADMVLVEPASERSL